MAEADLSERLRRLTERIRGLELFTSEGAVTAVSNNRVSVSGLAAGIGDEIAFGACRGKVVATDHHGCIAVPLTHHVPDVNTRARQLPRLHPVVGRAWLGRTVDGLGQAIDGRGPLPFGLAESRQAVPTLPFGERMNSGIAVLNTFLPLAKGQRIGIFAGPGVGKSQLLLDLGARVTADVVVWALIGERGRELSTLAEQVHAGGNRQIVVASLANAPAAAKCSGAELAMTLAESFAHQGADVLLLFDSLTRFAQAYREGALAAGEPPALEAYPPSTFTALSSLCERAGNRAAGSITAVFTVLVENDDTAGAVADAARGVLDGHIVLDRAIAERGRFPAIDVLRSISRCLPGAATPEENALLQQGRSLLALYEDVALLVRMGAYTHGNDREVDRAVLLAPALERFFGSDQPADISESFSQLKAILATG